MTNSWLIWTIFILFGALNAYGAYVLAQAMESQCLPRQPPPPPELPLRGRGTPDDQK